MTVIHKKITPIRENESNNHNNSVQLYVHPKTGSDEGKITISYTNRLLHDYT